ncbi:hypothetical protein [Bowmanella denitrificans]|nr:hypothetical protein [Bowmanella denitrificans]
MINDKDFQQLLTHTRQYLGIALFLGLMLLAWLIDLLFGYLFGGAV